ncbi:MAG: PAS domain-containing sensor histidine kinase [Tannerella sp.]|jgi:PAS domain S-box-containing protein|nr:PAS domain-containing sensor histidine kinase [Tannerella sp.]
MKDRKNYQHTLKHYNWGYAIALAVIAIIALSSQILIQDYLSNQQSDTHLVNYSAKLRSDSQSLTKYALLLQKGDDFLFDRKDFVNTLSYWKQTHRSLREGSEFLNIPKNEDKEIEELFRIIDKPYQEIVLAAEAISKNILACESAGESDIDAYVDILLKNEKTYLLGMEMIVFDYDRILRNNIVFLKKLEWILFFTLLVCLIAEALLIFIPLSGKLKASFKELINTEDYSRKLIEQVQKTNKELEQSHKELREVNFALEKATYLVKTDARGNIIYANDKYCSVTRYNMAELRGKPLFYNNMGGERSIIYKHIENPELCNEVWQGEVFDHASDGTGFWMNVTLMPIFNNKGELYRYYAICFDITKRKQMENENQLLMEEKIKQKDELQRTKLDSMLAGEERERKRLAAEIHDNIGQMLTALKMRFEFLPQNREYAEIKNIIASIVNETRKVCTELQPSVLIDFGLKAAINDLLKTIRSSTNIHVHLEDSMEDHILPKNKEIAVYRIIQEATNNIIKHARAGNMRIKLESDAENICTHIEDDGKGFDMDMDKLYKKDTYKKTYGLISMKERAEFLNADFEIKSRKGKGTVIRLTIPFPDM